MRWESGSGTGTWPDYAYNANNRIDVSAVTYDSAGNVTDAGIGIGNGFTYDDENRITEAAYDSASYVYDAFGHRVRSTVNSQTNDFLYDLNGKTIDELANGSLTRSEAYTPGGMHIATYAGGITFFDSSDWLSTFRVRTNSSGANVESCTSMPFGEDLTCSVSLTSEVSPLHFTGQEHDWESGNDHFAFRYYNEVMGRWLTPDPAGLASADPTNPQSWNRYAYVVNNPLSFVDSTGLWYDQFASSGCDAEAYDCSGDGFAGDDEQGFCDAMGSCDGVTFRDEASWLWGITAAASRGDSLALNYYTNPIPAWGGPDGAEYTFYTDVWACGLVPSLCALPNGNVMAANNGNVSCNSTTGICVPATMMKPRPAGCGAAIAQGAVSFGLDVAGAIPGLGNGISATVAGIKVGVALKNTVAYGGAAYGIATGLPDENPFGAASAGAGLGLTLADSALEGGKVIPGLGNFLSVVTGLYDGYQLGKTIARCW